MLVLRNKVDTYLLSLIEKAGQKGFKDFSISLNSNGEYSVSFSYGFTDFEQLEAFIDAY